MMTGTAVVTGGGQGIGQATARALSDAGWNVVVAGRTQETLDATVRDLRGEAMAFACDVTDETAVEALFATTKQAFGRVDLLFNNAGVSAAAATVDELDVETWRRVLDINVTGSFLCARAAFAQMRQQSPQGGRIINNGSISASTPRLQSAAYTTSKHAITGLTKSLALDGRPFSIACGQIDIGNVTSDMTAQMSAGVLQADGSTRAEPTMHIDNVTASIVHMASLPLDANVLTMTVLASGMPFVGRG